MRPQWCRCAHYTRMRKLHPGRGRPCLAPPAKLGSSEPPALSRTPAPLSPLPPEGPGRQLTGVTCPQPPWAGWAPAETPAHCQSCQTMSLPGFYKNPRPHCPKPNTLLRQYLRGLGAHPQRRLSSAIYRQKPGNPSPITGLGSEGSGHSLGLTSGISHLRICQPLAQGLREEARWAGAGCQAWWVLGRLRASWCPISSALTK